MMDDDPRWAEDVALCALDELLEEMGNSLAASLEKKRRRRLRWRTVAIGCAAAAALLAGVLLESGRMGQPAPPGPSASGLDVESPRPFVVFETRDPDMTVIWQLQGE